MGLLFCCMALSATNIYKLSVHQLRQLCVDEGSSCTGPVRELRGRLVRQLIAGTMANKLDDVFCKG